jgi:hypothetical protein
MKCPIDTDVDLVITDRAGVEIDYCPTCRGVWLDRGELDKLIDRASAELAPPAPAQPAPPMQQPMQQPMTPTQAPPHVRWDSSDPRYYGQQGYPKRRKSFLKEMFDF